MSIRPVLTSQWLCLYVSPLQSLVMSIRPPPLASQWLCPYVSPSPVAGHVYTSLPHQSLVMSIRPPPKPVSGHVCTSPLQSLVMSIRLPLQFLVMSIRLSLFNLWT